MSMRQDIFFPGIAAIGPILRHTDAGCAPRAPVAHRASLSTPTQKTPADWAGVRAGRRRSSARGPPVTDLTVGTDYRPWSWKSLELSMSR
jgi:hypothetical protein